MPARRSTRLPPASVRLHSTHGPAASSVPAPPPSAVHPHRPGRPRPRLRVLRRRAPSVARYLGGPQGPSGGKRPKAQDSNSGKGSGSGKGEPPALAPNMSDPLWQLMNVSVMVGQVTASKKRVVGNKREAEPETEPPRVLARRTPCLHMSTRACLCVCAWEERADGSRRECFLARRRRSTL